MTGMAGNGTRFGFAGAGTGEGSGAGGPSTRTVYGRELHLKLSSLEAGRATSAPEPLAPGTIEQPASCLDTEPYESFGSRRKSDTLSIPREPHLRTVGIVAFASLVSFFAVVALLKLRDTGHDLPVAPAHQTDPGAVGARASTAESQARPTFAPPIAPSPPPTITPVPPSQMAEPALSPPKVPAVRRAAPTHRASRSPRVGSDADSPLPLGF